MCDSLTGKTCKSQLSLNIDYRSGFFPKKAKMASFVLTNQPYDNIICA